MQRAVKCILALAVAALVCHVLLLLPLLHHRDQPLVRTAQDAPNENLLHSFDVNQDGVLDVLEFDVFVQEVCALDVQRLTMWQRLNRALSPSYWWSSPCSRTLWRSTTALLSPHNNLGRDGTGWASGEQNEEERARAQLLLQQQEQRRSDADDDWRQQRRQEEGMMETSTQKALRAGGHAEDVEEPDEEDPAADGRSRAVRRLLAGCGPLSRELLAAAAGSSRTVLLVVADWNLFDVLGVNWLAHVQAAGISNYLIGAMDAKTADFLVSNKLGHCFRWYADGKHGATPAGGYRPGSPAFLEARWRRVEALMRITAFGFDAVASDIDTIWLLDPVPYLRHHAAAADVVVSSDGLATENLPGDPGLETGALKLFQAGLPANASPQRRQRRRRPLPIHTGAMFVRASPGGRAALNGWAAARTTGSSDSEAFLKWAHGGSPVPAGGHYARRLVVVAGAGARPSAMVGLFSPAVVLNGYTYYVSQLHITQQLPDGPTGAPLALHMSRVAGGKESKVHRMREATWYADGPRYYSDFQLLSFNFTPPAPPLGFGAWRDEGTMLAWHVMAMSEQLAQLYWAMELAVLLDRALIMPPLQCYCYNGLGVEGVERCRALGDTSAPLPFNCTLDQVFNPAVMYQHAPVFEGKRLLFKEASFLQNPRLPGWIRATRTEVSPGQPACGGACVHLAASPSPGTNQQLTVPVGLNDTALAQLLQPFTPAKWLHITDVQGLRLSFGAPERQAAFEAWLQRALVPWCCRSGEGAAGDGAAAEGSGAEGAAGTAAEGAGSSDAGSAAGAAGVAQAIGGAHSLGADGQSVAIPMRASGSSLGGQ